MEAGYGNDSASGYDDDVGFRGKLEWSSGGDDWRRRGRKRDDDDDDEGGEKWREVEPRQHSQWVFESSFLVLFDLRLKI